MIALAGVTAWIIVDARRRRWIVRSHKAYRARDTAAAAGETVHVEMYDVEELIQFQPVDLPPDRLPASFESATTIHLGDRDFEVVEARPMTVAEFRASGKLRLVLREVKIEQVDPAKLLYSLPTIAMTLPPIEDGSSKLDKQTIEIHEDDWRQIEFVSRSLREQIDEHLADVRRIYDEERFDACGFRKLHTREGLDAPIAAPQPTVRELIASFETAPVQVEGVSFHKVAGLVERGFGLRLLGGLELIGLRDRDNRITALCLGYAGPNNAMVRDLPGLHSFMSKHDLVLIDWVRCELIEREMAALRGYFLDGGGRGHRNLIGFPKG